MVTRDPTAPTGAAAGTTRPRTRAGAEIRCFRIARLLPSGPGLLARRIVLQISASRFPATVHAGLSDNTDVLAYGIPREAGRGPAASGARRLPR